MSRVGWGRTQDVQARLGLEVGHGLSGMKLGRHGNLSWHTWCMSWCKPGLGVDQAVGEGACTGQALGPEGCAGSDQKEQWDVS